MRRDHWQWLESHLQEVNGAFEIDLSLDTPEARNIAEESIDIYDGEDAFNDNFEGVHLRWELLPLPPRRGSSWPRRRLRPLDQ